MSKQTVSMSILQQSSHYGFVAMRVELASGQIATVLAIPDDSLTDKEERSGVKVDDYGKEKPWSFPAHKSTFAGEKGSNGTYYGIPILDGIAKEKMDFQLFSEPQTGTAKTAVMRW